MFQWRQVVLTCLVKYCMLRRYTCCRMLMIGRLAKVPVETCFSWKQKCAAFVQAKTEKSTLFPFSASVAGALVQRFLIARKTGQVLQCSVFWRKDQNTSHCSTLHSLCAVLFKTGQTGSSNEDLFHAGLETLCTLARKVSVRAKRAQELHWTRKKQTATWRRLFPGGCHRDTQQRATDRAPEHCQRPFVDLTRTYSETHRSRNKVEQGATWRPGQGNRRGQFRFLHYRRRRTPRNKNFVAKQNAHRFVGSDNLSCF